MTENTTGKELSSTHSWFVLILAALIPTVAIVFTFVVATMIEGGGQAGEFSIYSPAFALGVLLSHSLIFLILYFTLRKNGLKLKDIYWNLRSVHSWWTEILIILTLGLGLYLFKEVVFDSIRAISVGNQPTFRTLFNFNFNPTKWYPLIIVPLVFVEESVFRGFAYRAFKDRYSTGGILILSSLLFGIVHIGNGLDALVFTSIMGAFYFGIFLTSKNLWRPYCIHVLYNVLIIFTS